MQSSILVVEDSTIIRDGLRFTMEAAGYQVLTAVDGMDALNQLHTGQVDLIISDVTMPRMNGYQFYNKVRQVENWRIIPFIFLSGYTINNDIRYGKALGVDDYLLKPIQPDDLLAVVRGKLRRTRQLAHHLLVAPAHLNSGPLIAGPLHISIRQHRIWLDGWRVNLSAREFKVLTCLAQHAGRVVTLSELVQVTYHRRVKNNEAGPLLYPIIRSIRRKLGCVSGNADFIRNIRGMGYQLVLPGDEK